MGKRSKTLNGSGLELIEVEPLTRNQVVAFESSKNLVLHGCAGTGKTFISCYLAFDDMTKNLFEKLVIMRSAVPTRDIGFLPGTEKEKSSVYEEPYRDIAIDLFSRGDAYQILKTKGLVHFMTTSYIRGITLRDAVILIDECQNMSFHELDSIITRVGEDSKILFCGDITQTDLTREHEKSKISDFIQILQEMKDFTCIEFGIDDIVRSGLVKQYLITKYNLGF